MPENKELPVYPMTAIDEITYRTPDALFNGQAVINVVHSCVPNIKNAWEIPGIDLNAVLIAIRIASYGHEMELATKCPKCETESDFGIDLRMVLDSIREPDYATPIRHGDLEITLMPVSYRNQNQVGLKQYEQQRSVQQIQSDPNLTDDEKIKRLNETMHLITELTIETLKYSIASIRTPDTLVTEIEFIRDFLVNCDRKLYQEIRDRVIELRNSSELKPFEIACPNCGHKHQQALTLDQAAFFGVAS
jgi:DNA-directed RNA polymerase subunit RPC12/RpoP